MDQLALPMDLGEDIPENHLVRVINATVNGISDSLVSSAYPGSGRDSYHPKMISKSSFMHHFFIIHDFLSDETELR